MTQPITVLIADDHTILRAGIRALLSLYPEFKFVGEAASGEEALDKVRELQPQVVLMDIGMPDVDGLTATREIKDSNPEIQVLILSQHENREYVLPALEVGASGYVLKRATDDALIKAIQAVSQGETFLDPVIADVVVEDMRRKAAGKPSDPYDDLTEREREVLVLLAKGKTYKETAEVLYISTKTVDFHRANLMEKLGLGNRAELTKFAVKRGIIS